MLNAYVPSFHLSVQTLEKHINSTNQSLGEIPLVGAVFKDNPIASNSGMQEFLAINFVKTGVITGTMATGGAVLAAGVKPSQVDRLIKEKYKKDAKNLFDSDTTFS